MEVSGSETEIGGIADELLRSGDDTNEIVSRELEDAGRSDSDDGGSIIILEKLYTGVSVG